MDAPQLVQRDSDKYFVQPDVKIVPDDHDNKPYEQRQSSSTLPFGLSTLVYTILVTLIALLITAVAFGGALGSIVSQKHKLQTM